MYVPNIQLVTAVQAFAFSTAFSRGRSDVSTNDVSADDVSALPPVFLFDSGIDGHAEIETYNKFMDAIFARSVRITYRPKH
jgi:hypothetical protein